MKLKYLTLIGLCLFLGQTFYGQLQIELNEVASGFNNPVDIVNAGDDRLFIVEKSGRIKILNSNGTTNTTNFLNVASLISSSGERGLLGLAFHPDYANNGYFYVHYTNTNGDSRVVRYTVSAGNPDVANAGSALVIFSQDQPFSNHNAGDINFGPDGYLYVPYGDGGSGGDPDNYSQNTQSHLGKMLRLDVDGGTPYAIPSDNPFVGDPSTLDEIWSIGLRNTWRFSFDALTGDMWMGDVGQNVWEEIDFEPAGTGGLNYGWRCKEGLVNFDFTGCAGLDLVDPVAVYNHSGGACSVTGGYVYRGTQFPGMYGKYIYTDYCNGQFRSLESDGNGGWNEALISGANGFGWTTFGEDVNNELYVANASGVIYQVTDPSIPTTVELNAKIYLEGPYNVGTSRMNDNLRNDGQLPLQEPYTTVGFTHVGGGGETTTNGVLNIVGSNAIVDWVFVELRAGTSPSSVLATQSALIQSDGDIVGVDGFSALTFDISSSTTTAHVAVRHRNHFGVRTNVPLSTSSTMNVDFSNPATAVFGTDPMTPIGGVNTMIAGDANADGQVNSGDKNLFWRVQNGITFNYLSSGADFNMDGIVNTIDKNNIWRINNSKAQQLD